MSEEKFAVYVVLVEDSNEADSRLAESVYSLDRIARVEEWVEGEDAMRVAVRAALAAGFIR